MRVGHRSLNPWGVMRSKQVVHLLVSRRCKGVVLAAEKENRRRDGNAGIAGWRRPMNSGVCDFPRGLSGHEASARILADAYSSLIAALTMAWMEGGILEA